jgi:hypothetical protein
VRLCVWMLSACIPALPYLWYGMVWYGMVWYGMVGPGTIHVNVM